jgi:hypothetical protein
VTCSNCKDGCIVSDSAFLECSNLLERMCVIHNEISKDFSAFRTPQLFLALSYQDGLIHALQRILKMQNSGTYYSKELNNIKFKTYEKKVTEYSDAGDFWNACYCRGYANGMLFLNTCGNIDDFCYPPIVDILFNENIDTIAKLRKIAKKNIPEAVKIQFEQYTKNMDDGFVVSHVPYV